MSWIGIFAAVAAVALMGFAIQRGGTCTVAAVSELLNQRRAHRLTAMLEASLWVAGGLALARLLGIAGSMPAGVAIERWTVIGGVLLGLGAWLNGACVFGAVARIGSGEWAYLLTPVGFYLGCLSVSALFARAPAEPHEGLSPLLQAAPLIAPLFVAYAVWRVLRPALRRPPWREVVAQTWAPHTATIVIGITFVITLLSAGRWAYTDVLADLARAMSKNLLLPGVLVLALLGGALLGGWTAGRWKHTPPAAAQLARCLCGGMLMAWGSLLIPGSNDGLILVGIPLLWPHAWLAFASMCIAIALAMRTTQSRAGQRSPA